MAKKKGSRNLNASDFIITPRDKADAKLKIADKAITIAGASKSMDSNNGKSFYELWEDAYDKLNK